VRVPLTPPRSHRDTYVEECHRDFFTNLGRGLDPEKCGVQEKHIGGLVMMLPVALYFANDPNRARSAALEHLATTHPGKEIRLAGEAILSLLLPTLQGNRLTDTIKQVHASQRNSQFSLRLSFDEMVRMYGRRGDRPPTLYGLLH
jgi:ADP-ribosyl-[dinitrogen reductase] hydrolase